MKNHVKTILIVLIFLFGLGLFLYPTVSNIWNEHLNSKLINNYEDIVSEIPEDLQAKMLEEARLYNKNMYNLDELSRLGLTYEDTLNINGTGIMGHLKIPKINVSLVIYHTVDENYLQDAIGHMRESSLPVGGKGTHSVLAGHRGLPSAKLLSNMDYLQIGDTFELHVLNETLNYVVDDISVVEPDEVSRLKIETDRDLVTLVTCTPYGINSHRLLVRGTRIDENSFINEDQRPIVPNDLLHIRPIYLIPICLIIITLLVYLGRKLYLKHKKKEKENNEES